MNKLYTDHDWLKSQYEDNFQSTYQIAKICNVDSECIRQHLKKAGVILRPANIINYSTYNPTLNEIISGSMLGDGSLIWGHENVSAYYSIANKHIEYLQFIKCLLNKFGFKYKGEIKKYSNSFGSWYMLQTRYYRGYLSDMRLLWYPNKKKTIPDNIQITPLVLRTFYIEDGSLLVNYKTNRVNSINLSMNDFMLSDVYKIRDLLSITLLTDNNNIRINKNRTDQYTIVINKRAIIKLFFDYIGNCPLEIESIYGYKWPIITDSMITQNRRD